MQFRRSVVLPTAAIALAMTIAPANAGAGLEQTQFPTQFTKFKYEVSDGKAKFEGKIDSAKSSCVNARKVKLIRKANGDEKKLGDDTTNSKGKFSIGAGSPPIKDGKYYAEVKEKSIDSGEKTCLSQTSGSIKLS